MHCGCSSREVISHHHTPMFTSKEHKEVKGGEHGVKVSEKRLKLCKARGAHPPTRLYSNHLLLVLAEHLDNHQTHLL